MKKYFLINILFLSICQLKAQNVTVIPNTSTGDIGLMGNLISYNNNLYFQYQLFGIPFTTTTKKYNLAKYNDTTIKVIANVNTADTGFVGYPIVFKNSLYFQYRNALGKSQLAKYSDSDTTISLIPNISTTDLGFSGYPIIYKNNLYFQYQTTAGKFQLAKWNDTTLTLIPNLGNSDIGYYGNPVIFNNKMYIAYQQGTLSYISPKLARWNDTTITLLNSDYRKEGKVFQGKLYFEGILQAMSTCLSYVDSSENISYSCSSALGGGSLSSPFTLSSKFHIYNNKLYYVASVHNMSYQKTYVVKFDGTNYGYLNFPSNVYPDPPYNEVLIGTYANSFYLIVPAASKKYFYRWNDITLNQMKGVACIGSVDGYPEVIHNFYLHQGNLVFCGQSNGASTPDDIGLAKSYMDTDTVINITNPSNQVGFYGSPLIHKNVYYFISYPKSNSERHNLSKLENIALPSSFISFSISQLNANSVNIKFTTANEVNIAYYQIQRSVNGIGFETIANINAHNTSSNDYTYTDILNEKVYDSKVLYYRIVTINEDGKKDFSVIKSLQQYGNGINTISIYPNPSKGSFDIKFLTITTGTNTIRVIDMYGKIVTQERKVTGMQDMHITYPLAKGVYTVQVINSATGKIDTQKLVIQ